YLHKLQLAHLENFCFSSLSVLLKEETSLEPEFLFDKIVTRRRGGYCFEHNGLFYAVLTALGFQCNIIIAQVLLNSDKPSPRTHRITKVTLEDKEYIVPDRKSLKSNLMC
ncbi:MAG: arylamine N-acetyltransferase, partial [Candidatus Brocadiaceae bacterium]|nr:arylamine N-acetyltransferase [Candidatus Brocadiaceae bacterium]